MMQCAVPQGLCVCDASGRDPRGARGAGVHRPGDRPPQPGAPPEAPCLPLQQAAPCMSRSRCRRDTNALQGMGGQGQVQQSPGQLLQDTVGSNVPLSQALRALPLPAASAAAMADPGLDLALLSAIWGHQ